MKHTNSIVKQLDAAIDRADMAEISRTLQALSAAEPDMPQAEDPKLFAARMQKLYKEQCSMKKPHISLKFAVVAAVVLVTSISVYAAGGWKLFSFGSGDRYVTVRTTESMTSQEAQALVQEGEAASLPENAVTESPETETFSFDSVAQAEQELDMQIPIPAKLPHMQLESASAQVSKFGENLETRTCWLNYADAQGRMFGITVSREVAAPGSSITGYATNDMDEGSLRTYTSKTGVRYDLFSESNEEGDKTAHIAQAMLGEYEYALVFFGFDEAQRTEIIDSTDLSVYR